MSFLDDFLDSVSALPSDLRTHALALRQLDERMQALGSAADASYRRAATRKRGSAPFNREVKRARVRLPPVRGKPGQQSDGGLFSAQSLESQQQVLADAKASLASCLYDVVRANPMHAGRSRGARWAARLSCARMQVDCHVRRLDDDLRRYETELLHAGIPTGDVSRLEDRIRGHRQGSRRSAASESEVAAAEAAANVPGASELPVDPNEPVYCVCRRVAFGDMIMCDNADCPFEWFHFRCVGITQSNRPKGRWLCQHCNALRKKGLLELPTS